jgi:hypothetical protein
MVRWSVVAAASLALAAGGCVAPPMPKVAGSEVGGTVSLVGITPEQASQAARNHCSKYGRTARSLATRPEGGGQLVFECI